MKNKGWLRVVTVIVFLIFGIIKPSISLAEETLMTDEKEKNSYGAKLEFIGPGDIKIKNMPFDVRNVPNHPDDGYAPAKNAGPIEKIEYDTEGTVVLGVFKQKKIRNIKLGIGLNWLIALTEDAKRNYTNNVGSSERGYGAALTYVSFGKYGIIPQTKNRLLDEFFLNITPELSAEVILDKEQKITLGSSLSYFHLRAVNGWDRYDKLESNQYFSLGYYLPLAVYLKYKWLTAGMSYPIEIQKTRIGNGADVKTNPSWFVGIKY